MANKKYIPLCQFCGSADLWRYEDTESPECHCDTCENRFFLKDEKDIECWADLLIKGHGRRSTENN